MWNLNEHTATLLSPSFAISVDTLAPWQGLQTPQFQNIQLANAHALQIDVRELIDSAPPIDCYIRGRDLIATYAPSSGRNVQTQIYWRSLLPTADRPAAGMEIILSAQTHLLDSRPALFTSSTFPGGELLALHDDQWAHCNASQTFTMVEPATMFLSRPTGADYSYVEMIAPSDFTSAQTECGSANTSLRLELFPEHLEKGVIRRARIRGLFLPRSGDQSLAAAIYHDFAREPLPLTT